MANDLLHVFEISFKLKSGRFLIALIEADDANHALRSIMSVWEPPEEVMSVHIKERAYFQVHIPSLTGYPKSEIEGEL